MTALDLPTSLEIGGVGYSIRSGWRNAINIFNAVNDPDLDNDGKAEVIFQCLYPDWIKIPTAKIPEALEKATEFLDCGYKRDNINRPRLIDWEQDAPIIISAINTVANMEIRLHPDIHWWTVHSWYMSSSGGLLATVLRIRQKQSKGKKLTKEEEEFLNDNRRLVVLQKAQTAEEKEIEEYFAKWL